MSSEEFHTLQRYAMKMARDPDDRDELVLLAWQESNRLGKKSSMPLLVNFMKLRARENNRSIIGTEDGGKGKIDAWAHGHVSLDAPVKRGDGLLLDFVSSSGRDPFGECVVKGFEEDLTHSQLRVAKDLIAGYSARESSDRLGMNYREISRTRASVREKALEHCL